jgi:hypothetical protein
LQKLLWLPSTFSVSLEQELASMEPVELLEDRQLATTSEQEYFFSAPYSSTVRSGIDTSTLESLYVSSMLLPISSMLQKES